jgi:hypothetical protein
LLVRLVQTSFDAGALGADHLVELLADLVPDAAEVVAVEALLPLGPKAVEELLQPHDPVAPAILEPALQHPL